MVNPINSRIEKLAKHFKEKNLSLVTVESCTGGGLAYFISKSPACSPILERGFITYSNPSKEDILKIDPTLLQTKGAVNKDVALQMAKGALKNSRAQVAISITGVNADTSGSAWICCLDVLGNKIIKYKKAKGTRAEFIQQVILEAIRILLDYTDRYHSKNVKG